MILQSLHELYDRLSGLVDNPYKIPSLGYSLQKIAFRLVITGDGSFSALQSLRDSKTKLSEQMIVPGGDKPTGKVTKKSVYEKAQFLRNDLSFLLGVSVEGDKNPTLVLAQMEFEAFKKVHLEREQQINDPDYSVFCKFLRSWKPEAGLAHKDWIAFGDGQGVIQLMGKTEYLHDRPAVRSWWDQNQPENESEPAQCLITGDLKPASRLHEPKIKSVKDSQPAGAPIVSFDKGSDAFSSYGHDGEQGLNAPTSEDATFRYATALNSLLAGPKSGKHRFTLGDATVVFWTDKPSDAEDIFVQFAQRGSTVSKKEEIQDEALLQKMQIFFKVLREGCQAYAEIDENPDQTKFFILGMTGQAKGRIGVRFFYRDTVGHLLDNLRKHYNDMKIIRQYEEGAKYPDPEFPPAWLLLRQTARDKDDIPPILSGPLLRAVITGSLYPEGLYKAVIRRIHADREINYLRASIIKGYLVRNQKQEVSMSLDKMRVDSPYRLGRLFAVYEKIQEKAFFNQTGRNLEKGIHDSYFSSACATPASVFPRIARLSTHHRRHLHSGEKYFFDGLLAEVSNEQNAFPSVLSMMEQGTFLLGYYHQWKPLHEKKNETENKEEK